ncbi:hypothetical protein F5Y10DRAFT_289119 [Nemania abortiva]|nr:hypothetical protein F5Y10DRAFT_289119 [Nemania abortiva]
METLLHPAKAPLPASLVCLTKAPNSAKHVEAKAIDIVAIHGLCGQSQNGTFEWLRDLVPKDIRASRVFAFNYDAPAIFTGSIEGLKSVANCLTKELNVIRSQTPPTRPLVFVCHGFGGLLIEECLIEARLNKSLYPTLGEYVKAIVFLSTPQRESQLAPWPNLIYNSARESLFGVKMPEGSRQDLLQRIKENAEAFRNLPAEFAKIVSGIKIVSCYEKVPTLPREGCSLNELHATLGIRTEKVMAMSGCTHQSLAVFSSREDENYKFIISAIKKARKSAAISDESKQVESETVTLSEHHADPPQVYTTKILAGSSPRPLRDYISQQSQTLVVKGDFRALPPPEMVIKSQQPEVRVSKALLGRSNAVRVASSEGSVYPIAEGVPKPSTAIITGQMIIPRRPVGHVSNALSPGPHASPKSSVRAVQVNSKPPTMHHQPQNAAQSASKKRLGGLVPSDESLSKFGSSATKSDNLSSVRRDNYLSPLAHNADSKGLTIPRESSTMTNGPVAHPGTSSKIKTNPSLGDTKLTTPMQSKPPLPQLTNESATRDAQRLSANGGPTMSRMRDRSSLPSQRLLPGAQVATQEKPGYFKKPFGSSPAPFSQLPQSKTQQRSWSAYKPPPQRSPYSQPLPSREFNRPPPRPQPQPQSHYRPSGGDFGANTLPHFPPQGHHAQPRYPGSSQTSYGHGYHAREQAYPPDGSRIDDHSTHTSSLHYQVHQSHFQVQSSHNELQPINPGEHFHGPTPSGSSLQLAVGIIAGGVVGGVAGTALETATTDTEGSELSGGSEVSSSSEEEGSEESSEEEESDIESEAGSDYISQNEQQNFDQNTSFRSPPEGYNYAYKNGEVSDGSDDPSDASEDEEEDEQDESDQEIDNSENDDSDDLDEDAEVDYEYGDDDYESDVYD